MILFRHHRENEDYTNLQKAITKTLTVSYLINHDFQENRGFILSSSNAIFNAAKVKQSRYRPGVSQRVPES